MGMIVMGGLWRSHPLLPGIEQWFHAATLNTLSLACHFFAVQSPAAPAVLWFLNHWLAVMALLFLLEGMLRFRGFESEERWKFVFVLGPWLAWLVWTFNESALGRTLLHDVLSTALLLACAVVILRNDDWPYPRALRGVMAFFCLFLALACVLRSVLLVQQMRDMAIASSHGLAAMALLVKMISQIGLAGAAAQYCHSHTSQTTKQLLRADSLTGLPNRRSMEESLVRQIALAERDHCRFGVIGIDLGHFRQIRERIGEHESDVLLQAAARRLRECTREADLTGRLEGDDFLIIVARVSRSEHGHCAIERLQRDLQGVLDRHGLRHAVNIRAGLALWPEDGRTAEELIRQADHRVYEFKQRCLAAATVV